MTWSAPYWLRNIISGSSSTRMRMLRTRPIPRWWRSIVRSQEPQRERSAVLLRNEGALLPLAKTARRIAVIGPLGNTKGEMNGPWSLTAKEEDTVSVFEGIRAKLPDSHVEFAEGVQIAKEFPSSFEGLIGPKTRDALESRRGRPPDEERAEAGRRF